MKSKHLLISCCALLVAAKASALDQAKVPQWKAGLSSSNSKARIAAIEGISDDAPETNGNAVLPLLVSALTDNTPEVRCYAATTLQQVAMAELPKVVPLQAASTDIKSYAPAQAALYAAIDDSDLHTKQAALAAYTLLYPIDAQLQDKLAGRFATERDPLSQQMIMVALTMDGNLSAKANDLISGLLKSPSTSWKVAKAVAASANPPENVLPSLVDQFAAVDTSDKRAELVTAIAKYGVKAKPYVSRLNATNGKESNPAVKRLIQDKMKAIQGDQ